MVHYLFNSIANAGVMVANNIDRDRSSVLFLDRDGIIIKDVGHISKKSDVELVPGIDQLLQRSRDAGMLTVVVTNQSSLARGIISLTEYIEITNHMIDLLGNSMLDMIIASFYHPAFSQSHCNSSWRKPGSGMFLYALGIFNLEVDKCMMIGDRSTDIIAAEGIGIKNNYLFFTSEYPNEINGVEITSRCHLSPARIVNSLDLVLFDHE